MSAAWRTLDGTPTRVIAHRGASGPLPEHTLAGYRLAIEQGADIVEPDLVVSRDGVLIVRHDIGLHRSTDIASRAHLAERRIDGDWPVHALDCHEIVQLRAIQPFRQRSAAHDGEFAVPTFDEVLAWAEQTASDRSCPIALYPEIKHPTLFAAAGIDPVSRFVERVRAVDRSRIELRVQCFEIEALGRLRAGTGLPAFLLLEADADWRAALAAYGDQIDGFGAAKSLLHDPEGRDSGFVAAAHARGLEVHAWTYRDDVLPNGVARVEDELDRAFALGVDAVFCDFPATALARRARYASD